MFLIMRNASKRRREEEESESAARAKQGYDILVDRVALLADGSKFTWSEKDRDEMREKSRRIIREVRDHYSIWSLLFGR